MEIQNQAVTLLAMDSLDDETWQPVSSRYATELRINLLIYGVLLFAVPWGFYLLDRGLPFKFLIATSAVVVAVFTFLAVVWVPKRVRYTQYLLRELDMNMRKGCWWHTTTSLGINRIQHMEVTQGPIERWLGLSKLALFTAGGHQSDLKLPGLEIVDAKKLKARLLKQVAREELDEELL